MIAAAARLMWRAAVTAGSVGAAVGTVHTAVNAGLLRRPAPDPGPPGRVSVLLPLRNEADRVEPALRSLLDQGLCLMEEVSERSLGRASKCCE